MLVSLAGERIPGARAADDCRTVRSRVASAAEIESLSRLEAEEETTVRYAMAVRHPRRHASPIASCGRRAAPPVELHAQGGVCTVHRQ